MGIEHDLMEGAPDEREALLGALDRLRRDSRDWHMIEAAVRAHLDAQQANAPSDAPKPVNEAERGWIGWCRRALLTEATSAHSLGAHGGDMIDCQRVPCVAANRVADKLLRRPRAHLDAGERKPASEEEIAAAFDALIVRATTFVFREGVRWSERRLGIAAQGDKPEKGGSDGR